MRVLVACEFSGTVRDAFTAFGHDATSCDLLPSDYHGKHYQGDILDIINDGWDLMIAHPPCTYLCNGGNAFLNKRPELEWRKNRQLAFEFVKTLYEAPIKRIAIENPIGALSSLLRKPDQIVRPFWFGHEYNKDICLWLKNLPELQPTYVIPPPYKKLDFWSNKRNPNGRSLKSITFEGFALAMAEQWGNLEP